MQQILSLGQKEAQLAIRVIQMALERQNKAAVIAVADAHGELIALLRLDGAPYPSILIATNKAWTAARERKATRELGQAARHPENGFDMAYFGDSRYIGWGGGMPVVVAGKVVGAVAVSGLPEAEDMVLAEMGVAAIVAGMSLAAASHSPHLTCQVVRPGEAFIGKQALSYAPGISAESVGAQGIHLQLVTIPPRGRAKAHLHEQHETAIYILSGESHMWYGANLTEHLTARATDFLYIPANMPHLPYNASETEPCVALIARTDPNEQESVVLLPELDKDPFTPAS